MVRVCADYGLDAGRIPTLNGTWIGTEGDPAARKIGAVGVRISRWITMHGFALNVSTDLTHFERIVPCGIREHGVTSLARELGVAPSFDEVLVRAARHFAALFEADLTFVDSPPVVPESLEAGSL
jgi:lipoyl(octanoyl) transferase